MYTYAVLTLTPYVAEDERLELSSEQAHAGIPNQALTIRVNPQNEYMQCFILTRLELASYEL